jgi:hypothetical protein
MLAVAMGSSGDGPLAGAAAEGEEEKAVLQPQGTVTAGTTISTGPAGNNGDGAPGVLNPANAAAEASVNAEDSG